MVENLVIIPTHNEKELIAKIIEQIFSLPVPFHILIIDNNSDDGTALKIKELSQQMIDKLFLIEHKKKNNIGNSYILGFQWALSKGYEYIFQMDSDFAHHPTDLIKLHEACSQSDVDVVIGSRYKTGLNVMNIPMSRILMSYLASAYVRQITGMRFRDTTTGFVCFKRSALKDIDLKEIRLKGSAFQIAMKHASWVKGHRIMEIPVIFANSDSPSAKLSTRIFGEAVFGVLKLRFRNLFIKNRLKKKKINE